MSQPQLFRPVDPGVSFPALETGILDFWRERDVFRRSIAERPAANLFVFYEGPPTANGRPGVHHVMPRVIKDLFARYKTMRGYRVPRKAGWDTHGLPVEIEVEKELGLSSKPEIEAYGIAEFNAKCRESVNRYVGDFEELTERIAFWVDMENPYVTYDNDYIERCWWIFKQLAAADLIYRDYRSTPHCPRCETSLSDHELSQGYRDDVDDPSVYIKFRLPAEARERIGVSDGPAVSIVAWTTTPWTLPGNTALAVKEDARYGLYEHEGERLIVAEALAESVLGGKREALRTFTGAELVDLAYEPLYTPEDVKLEFELNVSLDTGGEPLKSTSTVGGRVYVQRFTPRGLSPLGGDVDLTGLRRVIAADHVSLSDGTGIVHIAPAFGGEDFEDGKRNGLLFAQPVLLDGKMGEDLPGAGLFVKDADREVIRDLSERGLLLRSERIKHTYPFCWRCDSPVLYYAKPSWYIRTTREKEQLLAGNERITWQPEHIKRGRFGNWLENNVDWAVSRERYWGTPLPFWDCKRCGTATIVGSRQELLELAVDREAVEALEDLHRPFIDDIKLRCNTCDGETQRVPEVADAWFDSGAMPYWERHPEGEKEEFEKQFPADFICEAIDQTRGWFYTLHAEAALLKAAGAIEEGISYRNVICHGHILDEQGAKMSKSRGNVLEPFDLLDELGADAVRWYIYASAPVGSSRRFSVKLMNESLRRFQLTLWNVYSFFVSYANIDGLDPRERPQGELAADDALLLLDLNKLCDEVTVALEEYDPTTAARAIEVFVDSLSDWYVRDSRRRFWRGVSGAESDKQGAYFALHTTLTTLARLLAPFTPFLAEELWRNLARSLDGGVPESVHLTDWPDPIEVGPFDTRGMPEAGSGIGGTTVLTSLKSVTEQDIAEHLRAERRLVNHIASMGRAAREKAGIRVRQPLAEVIVRPMTENELRVLERYETSLLEKLNVKGLTPTMEERELVTWDLKLRPEILGPRLGKDMRAVTAELASLERDAKEAVIYEREPLTLAGHKIEAHEYDSPWQEKEGLSVVWGDGYWVGVATATTPELADEGRARDIVRHIQVLRREAGFELADRITAWCAGGETVARVLAAHGDYVRGETLAVELHAEPPPEDARRTTFKLDGAEVVAGVRRRDA